MISNSILSSISLSFNNSIMAHLGSRVYRTAIETLEGLFGDAFSPNQLCSGGRLYQLVDTYRQSKRDIKSYDGARFYYAGGIVRALQSERDPLEKTRKVNTILNTHIMGLSILQNKDKVFLSKHISYTLLPTLVDEFGKKMATRSLLALHVLDGMTTSGGDEPDRYFDLYRDITLQQKELDSFVQALDQLNSGISKDILINELLLARNRNLSKEAKDKIAEILQSQDYIDIKLHKKLQILEFVRSYKTDGESTKPPVLSELHTNRNNQLQALCHRGPSMFFPSEELDPITLRNDHIFVETEESSDTETSFSEKSVVSASDTPPSSEESDSRSLRSEDLVYDTKEFTTSQSSSPADEARFTPATNSNEPVYPPVGISNSQLNCWYNSTLQILRNTPIYLDMLKQKEKFVTDFPAICGSFNLYQRVFVNHILFPESLSKSKTINVDFYLPHIRKEAHHNLDTEFKEVGISQEDSQRFLYTLLNKLSIPVAHHIWLPGEEIPSAEERHLFLEKPAPSQLVDNPNIALIKIDLKTLFAKADHQFYGIIFHSGADYSRGQDFNSGHYFVTVKMKDSWYLCNDSRIKEISEAEVEDLIQKNKALLIASRIGVDPTDSDVD